MKTIDKLRTRMRSLLSSPADRLGRAGRFVRFNAELAIFCARRMREHNAPAMSASLSFRTIFTMVPVIVLGFTLLGSLGAVDDQTVYLRRTLNSVGLGQIYIEITPAEEPELTTAPASQPASQAATAPASAPATQSAGVASQRTSLTELLEPQIAALQKKLTLKRIGPVGITLMIWTALTLLITMERSLNRIFGAVRARPFAMRVVVYWTAMTLGPILLITVEHFANRAIEAVADIPRINILVGVLAWMGPVLMWLVLVAAVYKLMPNTQVRYSAAIGGAMVALPVWLAARFAFAWYVRNVASQGNVYGLMGLVPLFLLWLYLSWLIFLFGAELAHTAANLSRMRREAQAEMTILGPADLLAAAVAVAEPYYAGEGSVSLTDVAERLSLPDVSVRRLMQRLHERGVVLSAESEMEQRYVLARSAERIRLLDVLDLADPNKPLDPARRQYDPSIHGLIRHVRSHAKEKMGELTLADALDHARHELLEKEQP